MCDHEYVAGTAAIVGATLWASNNLDIVSNLADFVGARQYLFFALVSRSWRNAWGQRPKVTSYATPHSSVSQLFHSFECGLPRDGAAVCRSIARFGSLELLRCARNNGCLWDEDTCSAAASGGRLEVLQWAREHGCFWNADTCTSAARGGHLQTLKWARANGCPWDSGTCREAAEGGHVDVIRWARTNGSSWDMWTVSWSFKNGHLDLLANPPALDRLEAVPGRDMIHVYH